ncbi:MAG: TRAP transporter large permease subunit [Nitrospinota bacterium]|nr:MAG: TRAP transporter large permease subunit [Nitrospinota bacterium]
MNIEIAIVLILFVVTIILFATELLSVDLIALVIMSVLLLTGIVSPEEGIAGFSNTATVTVGAMFVLSAGLLKTGAMNTVGTVLATLSKRNFWFSLIVLMFTIGVVSAFINNTAAVAIFLPIVLRAASEGQVSPSKLLMPLSFASIFGGVCTLIGTSTNILVNAIARQHGLPGFSMFEFSSLGVIFFGVGLLYMLGIGVHLIPNRRTGGDLTQDFGMGEYLTEVILLPESKSVGKALVDSPLVHDLDLDIIGIERGGVLLALPGPEVILQENDILRVRCKVEKIKQMQEWEGIKLHPDLQWRDRDLESAHVVLVEAIIAPNSILEGRTLRTMQFRTIFQGTVLAIRHRGEVMHENLRNTPLRSGDVLLIEVRRDHLLYLQQHPAFIIVTPVGGPEFRKEKILPALLIISGVVIAATFSLLPIVVSAIVGCVLLILTRCIELEEVYQAIEWKVIFLLAGVLTLGVAIEKSGAALLISHALIEGMGSWGPVALLSAFFLLTSVLTNIISNTATAALLAPIAIATARSLDLSPHPFLLAVTFAASLSFMTPIGYQTNTMIYGPGRYTFSDFLRVGTPLTLLFWLLATLLIPRIWPF